MGAAAVPISFASGLAGCRVKRESGVGAAAYIPNNLQVSAHLLARDKILNKAVTVFEVFGTVLSDNVP